MTTSNSPLHEIKAQADHIAKYMKQAERGEIHEPKLIVARAYSKTFKPAIAMDDKTIILEMTWLQIRDTSEAALSEMIVKHMRGATVN
jgi:hypothetical protein